MYICIVHVKKETWYFTPTTFASLLLLNTENVQNLVEYFWNKESCKGILKSLYVEYYTYSRFWVEHKKARSFWFTHV